ncbi:hypothetical protein CMV_003706 [Castanea mollissima]|uniref:Uncharacterized protein n=1 Tax=Castanea mollissima TaxID=60419 RepID=A0A8J4W5C2_9ROSI|nr:hypothetical protein CMV_003706 [Castanea mollissima]
MVSSGCEIGVGLVVAESKPSSALGSRRSDQEASGFLGSDPVLQTHDVDNFLQVQDLNPEAPRSFPEVGVPEWLLGMTRNRVGFVRAGLATVS